MDTKKFYFITEIISRMGAECCAYRGTSCFAVASFTNRPNIGEFPKAELVSAMEKINVHLKACRTATNPLLLRLHGLNFPLQLFGLQVSQLRVREF